MKIYSIPAYLSNFSTSEDRRTYADLKVFYVGETSDGRVFNQDFADKLVLSLPYTPVVAFFSDLKDDFIGHNTTQYIYGIVRHDANIRYEEDENGTKWLITSVMLYSDRLDNIGEVAKKIVGKQHSLEMDPNKTKYKIIKENGKQKIVFTESSLLGLSVLGDSQQPAFTGSEFFTINDFTDVRERFENFFSFLQNKDRGEQMEREHFQKLSEFVKLSYTEKMAKVAEAVRTQLGDNYCSYLVDMNDEKAVFVIYNWETGKEEYHAYGYSITEEENVTLTSDNRVYPVYLTMEEREKLESLSTKPQSFEEEKESQDNPDDEDGDEEDTKPKKEENAANKPESNPDGEQFNSPTAVETTPEVKNEEGQSAKNKETNYSNDPSIAALTRSEREELEGYRREKKIGLINSYSEELSSNILEGFKKKVDELTFTDLEVALALEFRKVIMQNKATSRTNTNVPFSFSNVVAPTTRSSREPSYEEIIKRNIK